MAGKIWDFTSLEEIACVVLVYLEMFGNGGGELSEYSENSHMELNGKDGFAAIYI